MSCVQRTAFCVVPPLRCPLQSYWWRSPRKWCQWGCIFSVLFPCNVNSHARSILRWKIVMRRAIANMLWTCNVGYVHNFGILINQRIRCRRCMTNMRSPDIINMCHENGTFSLRILPYEGRPCRNPHQTISLCGVTHDMFHAFEPHPRRATTASLLLW